MSGEKPDLPAASLDLRQTRLRVEEGELVRRNESGGVVMRVPFDDVESVAYVRELNTFAVATILVAGGLVAIGYYVSEYNVVRVLLYVGAMLIGVFGLFALRGDVIEVRTRGESLRIPSPDPTDEVIGFVMSLKQLCGGRRDLG
ncbi:MAG: hypothetical protein JWO38_7263 [Gemmataceae bacterium]|nr:hypothetical protein [Gemmataceae bacterium]